MKKSKFTEEQIVGILRETDRDLVATVAKRHGANCAAWRARLPWQTCSCSNSLAGRHSMISVTRASRLVGTASPIRGSPLRLETLPGSDDCTFRGLCAFPVAVLAFPAILDDVPQRVARRGRRRGDNCQGPAQDDAKRELDLGSGAEEAAVAEGTAVGPSICRAWPTTPSFRRFPSLGRR